MQDTDVRSSLELWWKAALLAGLATLVQQAALAPAVAQTVNYSRASDTVVASYSVEPGELAGDDTATSVRIYGDGRAEVHVPRHRKDAGDFTTRLSPAEMDDLMAALVANGVLDFDAAAVKQAKRDAARLKGGGAATVLSESTDPSITTIELRVRSNTAGAAGGTEVSKTVRWVGLETDAQQYADIAAIRKLDAASQRLQAVMQRPDLQRRE